MLKNEIAKIQEQTKAVREFKEHLELLAKGDSIDEAVATYKTLKAQIAKLEAQLQPVKEALEHAASQTADGVILGETFKVTLVIAQRENFKLKDAKAILGAEILEPFISTSTYSQLRVS